MRDVSAALEAAKGMANLTSIPVYEQIITAKRYKQSFSEDDLATIAELVAIDLTLADIEGSISEILKSASAISITGGQDEQFKNTSNASKKTLSRYRQKAFERYAQAIKNLQKLRVDKKNVAGDSGGAYHLEDVLNVIAVFTASSTFQAFLNLALLSTVCYILPISPLFITCPLD